MDPRVANSVLTSEESRIAVSPVPAFDWLSTGMQFYYIASFLVLPIILIALALAFRRGEYAWGLTITLFGCIPPFNLVAGVWFAIGFLITDRVAARGSATRPAAAPK